MGAAGLVVGNVVIGRREEEGDNPGAGVKVGREAENEGEERREGYRDRAGEEDRISDGVELVEERTKDGLDR